MKSGSLIVEALVTIFIVFMGVIMVMTIMSTSIGKSDQSVSMSKLNDFEDYVSQYILRQGIAMDASSLEASTPEINDLFVGTNTSYMRLVSITVEPTLTQADITVRPVKFEIIAGRVKRIYTVIQGKY